MITIYKFSAEWCGPCKLYRSTFEKASKNFTESHIEFKEFDVEESPELIEKYSIRSVPTTIIEVRGEIRFKRVGVLTEAELTEEINKVRDYYDNGD